MDIDFEIDDFETVNIIPYIEKLKLPYYPILLLGILFPGCIDNNGNINTDEILHNFAGNDEDIIKLLAINKQYINLKIEDDKTILMYLIKEYYYDELAEYLIKKGVDLEIKDDEGKTALIYAIDMDNLGMVGYLLERGANTNTQDNKGWTPLIYIIETYEDNTHSLQMIEYLVNHNFEDNEIEDENGRSIIVENNTDLLLKDKEGLTALDHAINKKNWIVVDYLESAFYKDFMESDGEIDVESVDNESMTALMRAIIYNHLYMVKRLIDNGADVNAKNDYDESVLDIAIQEGNEEIINYLKNKGAE